MKMPKKFDIIIFAALFVCAGCLGTTAVIQRKTKNDLSALTSSEQSSYASSSYSLSGNARAESSEVLTDETEGAEETQDISEAVIGEIDWETDKTEGPVKTTKKTTASETVKETTKRTTTQKLTTTTTEKSTEIDSVLVINKNSKKIHSSTCSYAVKMKDENKITISKNELDEYLADGYTFCSKCQGYKE